MNVYDDFEMVQPMPEDQVCRSSFPVMSDNFYKPSSIPANSISC